MAMELRCTITEAHEEAILAITLNVLRDELYSAGIDGVIKLWDLSSPSGTGKLIRTQKGHKGWITDLLYVPQLNVLFSASTDNTILVWGEKGRMLWLEDLNAPVHSLAWNAKRKLLIVSVGHGTVCFFKVVVPPGAGGPPRGDGVVARIKKAEQVDAFKVLTLKYKTTNAHSDVVTGMCSSESGRVYTSGYDRTIVVHESERGDNDKKVTYSQCHSAAICSSTIDTDNNWIITGGYEGAVKIFSQEGRCLDSFQTSTHPITSLVFLPTLKQYWAAGKGAKIRVYDPRTPANITSSVKETARLDENPVIKLRCSVGTRGDVIAGATADRSLVVWKQSRSVAHRVVRGHFDWVESICTARRPGHRSGDESDAPHIFTCGTDGLVLRWTPSSSLNTDVYQCDEEYTGHRGAVTVVAYEPELDVLISGSEDSDVRIWNLDNSRERAPGEDGEGDDDGTNDLIAELKASKLDADKAVGSGKGQAQAARKQEDGEQVTTPNGDKILSGHTARVTGLAVCADFVLASASHDRSIIFWDMHTGHQLASIEEAHEDGIYGLLYCEEREELLSWSEGSSVAKVWSSYKRDLVCMLDDHNGDVQTACWCEAMGSWITAARDNFIRIWDEEGKVTRCFRYRGDECSAMICDGPEGYLFVATVDTAIRGYALLTPPIEEDVTIFGDLAPPPLIAKWSGHTDCVRGIVRIHEKGQYASVGWDKSMRFWKASGSSSPRGGYGEDSNAQTPATMPTTPFLGPGGAGGGAASAAAAPADGNQDEEKFISSYEREHPLVVPKALRRGKVLPLRFSEEPIKKSKRSKGKDALPPPEDQGLPAVLARSFAALDAKLLEEHYGVPQQRRSVPRISNTRVGIGGRR